MRYKGVVPMTFTRMFLPVTLALLVLALVLLVQGLRRGRPRRIAAAAALLLLVAAAYALLLEFITRM